MKLKHIVLFLLLIPSIIYGQEKKRFWNPFIRAHDYYSQYNPVNDSVINFGTNNVLSEDTLNGVIGHGNLVNAPETMALGYFNSVNKSNNLLFGYFLSSDTTHTITIGRGLTTGLRMTNSRYGSVGLGYFSSVPIMYIQSGYEPGETYTADIGGVSIGGPDLDTLTTLQINKHLTDPDSYFLKCKNWNGGDVFTLDYDGNAELSGILIVDSVVCSHVPTIHQAAGDTSNYNTPDKIGDLFINTSAGDTYISVGSSRGDWVKLNGFMPLLLFVAPVRKRRRLFAVAILLLSVFACSWGQRLIKNPFTRKFDFVQSFKHAQDTLINIGYDNYFEPGKFNSVIGYGNSNFSQNSMVIGWNSNTGCLENLFLGSSISCGCDKVIAILGKDGGINPSPRIPGSIALGYSSEYAIMHVHSGYPMGSNAFRGNVGGVRIGPINRSSFDLNTALEIVAHDNSETTTTILATESDELVIDNTSMTLSGSLEAGYLETVYTPTIQSAAGDTSLLPVPLKTGDIYIDTSAKDVYISAGIERGKWKKVN